MTDGPQRRTDFSNVESRRSSVSYRRMSFGRRLVYFVGAPLVRGFLALLWRTYRIETVIGADIANRLIADRTVCMPCYWHQQHLLCASMIREWIRRGFEACIVISASVDGEVPAKIAAAWGAEIIRGSANQTGSLVMRDMRAALHRGKSIPTTPDGPNGPSFEFKAGTILMARISGVPLVPLAFAADRCWQMTSWDKTIIPKPFARIVLGIGEPCVVPTDAAMDDLETHRVRMQEALLALGNRCRSRLSHPGDRTRARP